MAMRVKFSLGEFLRKYNNEDACIEKVLNVKFPNGTLCNNPKCKFFEKVSKLYKIKGRMVYQCSCGYQISPLAGTVFEKTTTPLQYWFYAIFLMTNTRSGVSAKQLQRELGVTYKTAWRIFKQIRTLMANSNGGNKAYLKHIPNTGKWALLKQIKDNVDPTARVITDEYYGYTQLKYHGYGHDFVKHKDTYVVGDIYTQNVEGLWSIVKRGIYGVYRVVSKKYLQAYIDEYSW